MKPRTAWLIVLIVSLFCLVAVFTSGEREAAAFGKRVVAIPVG